MNSHDHDPAVTGRGLSTVLRITIIAVLIGALILVGFDNRDDVRVGYVIGDTEAPIWTVLVVAAIAGIVIGWILRHRPRHH
jgi:uncharacterized integral membrane protein